MCAPRTRYLIAKCMFLLASIPGSLIRVSSSSKPRANPGSMASAIRHGIAQIDKGQPASEFAIMDEIVSQSMSAQTFSTALLGIFVGIALLLAFTV
jgi:hypothetical protein